MRRALVAVLGAALIGGMAAPAWADKPFRSTSATAEAFWHYRQDLSPTTYEATTWYVGVFQSSDSDGGTFSDLYVDVESCQTGPNGDNCVEESEKFGFIDFSAPGDTFTMDLANMSTAHLEATYQLQAYDENGDPVGPPETHAIVADWAGQDPLTRMRFKSSFHSRCIHFSTTTKGVSRPAEATGTRNGEDLGVTSDAFMSGDSSFSLEHTC
jgi:hypothetical protein